MSNIFSHNITESDRHFITGALRKKPQTPVSQVIARCPQGHPSVLEVAPLNTKMQPFPSTYWLLCPSLVKQVTALEYQGIIKHLQNKIDSSERLQNRLADNHRQYIHRRQQLIHDKSQQQRFTQLGISGNQNFNSVKCLHGHYAHYLATKDNYIGRYIHTFYNLSCHLTDIDSPQNLQ